VLALSRSAVVGARRPNPNAPQESAEHSARHLLPIPIVMSEQNPATAATLDAKTLETAADICVFDHQGGEVRFGDIFADSKTLVVFIRAPTTPGCTHTRPYLMASFV